MIEQAEKKAWLEQEELARSQKVEKQELARSQALQDKAIHVSEIEEETELTVEEILGMITRNQVTQNNNLKSIKNYLGFLVLMVILGLILSFCSAVM